MEEKKIYIVGAGVSGLIAAFELEQRGYAPVVLEKSDSVGGRVKTVNVAGVPLDLGFQVLLDGYPMVEKYLDKTDLQLNKLVPGAFIYHSGKSYLIGDPLREFRLLIPVLFARIGSFGDKWKILKLNRLLKNKSIDSIFEAPEQTTLEYLRAFGFSEITIERFFRPFFSGIFLENELHTSCRMFEFVYKMFGEGHATIPLEGIGAIASQLKKKLTKTQFEFNTTVSKVDSSKIYFDNDTIIEHQGLIVATDPSSIISDLQRENVPWKSCYCLYFEVDKTNIPTRTIALVADPNRLSNNLYAYRDRATGKQLLSVTVVRDYQGSMQSLTEKVMEEMKEYVGAKELHHLHTFDIKQALPDLHDLKNTAEPSDIQVLENVFLAGDYLLNGSLNAAMVSGKLAARDLVEKQMQR